MKKLLSSLLTLVVLFGITSGKFAYATQDEGAAGANTKRSNGSALGYVPYKELQLVRWGENGPNAVSLSAGDVVLWDAVSDDGVTIALKTSAVSADAVAGVVVSTVIQSVDSVGTTPAIDYGRRNWGYIQVKGYCPTVNISSGPALAGGAIYASGTARYAAGSTAAYNANNRVLGFAYDASSQGQAEAYIDL